ncbi:Anaphase-promoting complex subunit 2 [Mortierella polycephala]|uniref:Anaphase-promoting complex subunit 2 n=1 Tax=Mortierella polycephala TaxID=41804 RepID=A0A9P6U8C3_9FUNG|nr:Anaphase-promoting complex subunit 2 [Mortierella polycephala]
MDLLMEDQWSKAVRDLTAAERSLSRTSESKKPIHSENNFADHLMRATTVFTREMDPDLKTNPRETLHSDALSKLVPLLNDIESQYQDHISSGLTNLETTEWVIPAFYKMIDAIHGRVKISRELAELFDEQVCAGGYEPSLEISSRFLAEFSAELASHLPRSFDAVAHLYFEATFRQYEASHPGITSPRLTMEESQWKTDPMVIDTESRLFQPDEQSENDEQGLRKNRRRVMQDGRFAMDLFVDDKDDELVEKIFHQSHAPGKAETLARSDEMQDYLDLCLKLEEIGFVSHMTHVVTRMLYTKVESKILDSFKKMWTTATLNNGKDWMSFVILPFLRLTLLPRKGREDPTGKKRFKMWASRLEFYFFKTFGDLRIGEFFDIIVECPSSAPAVSDLKACVEWTGQREQLKDAILTAMDKRLLHPGAETISIIEFYISTIKYLRILDPSGVMLDHTARAVNQYLRTREDTMRAIVSCIFNDTSDLLNNSTEGIQANVEVDDEGSDNEFWAPEPVNAGPDLSSARRRMADIISVLANIYDTNDKFIEEFQTILADRLTHATDYTIDREIRQLELLKLRFGDTDLHDCEVMLADVAESKRVNANIHSLHPDMTVSATVASRYYWPAIEDEPLELPEPFKELLNSYSSAFEASKPAQKLHIMASQGTVDLELELEDRTIQMQVEPTSAAIIYLFQEQDTWTLAAISAKLQLPEESLEPKMQFWIREGLLRETGRFQYLLIENVSSSTQ